jgi:hypothetical protein
MRRRPDGVALAFGLVFLGIAALWLVSQLIGLAPVTVGWFVAGGLMVLGLAGIVSALTGTRRRHADDPDR